MENIKGVSLKELFVGLFWQSDNPKREPEQSAQMDKEWQAILADIDRKEKSIRNGGQVSSKSGARRTGRTNSLKKMQVKNSSKRKEPSSISRDNENVEKEREE